MAPRTGAPSDPADPGTAPRRDADLLVPAVVVGPALDRRGRSPAGRAPGLGVLGGRPGRLRPGAPRRRPDGSHVDGSARLVSRGEPSGPHGWLHGDLKPTNLLVREGRLRAVIDFGCLSVGFPDAEHSTVWDLPPDARQAYWSAAALDEPTWTRARAWAIAASGISYYWNTYPAFVAECRARLTTILTASSTR